MADMPNLEGVSVYVDTDDNGNLTAALVGKKIIPDRQYDFFFYADEEIANQISDYKVEITGFKASLIKVD